jgi:pantetheine-phosphate adenylyltransferase
MQKRYKLVATGGTFDIIHKGHLALLQKAFEVSESVIIGVTSDKFAAELNKKITNNYYTRASNLTKLLNNISKNGRYEIKQLNEDFGPALYTNNVEALIASKETEYKGALLNRLRAEKGLRSVDVVTVDLALAKDGKRISSTRIRSGEIDPEGNLL